MFIHRRRGWEISESSVTPEALVLARRSVLAGAAGLAAVGIAGPARAAPNPRYAAGRALTDETDATTYNNFYEFGTDKSIWRAAQRLPVSPWQIEIAGMVDKPRTMDLEDLLKHVSLEERIYRHRCVEAWAMTVPWTGFPLAALVKLAAPTSGAKYITFETLANPKVMPGIRSSYFSWPYIEGLTMQEAQNEMAFLVTGMYGKPVPKQDGAPIRLILPWKYGFKSAKSIVKITFTDKRPDTFWAQIQPDEYGFWANVNPAVPHPRWSQATERLLGSDERVPTVIWNGYGEFVASMYTDKKNERLFV
jgi:methionine sulfoxide reductase catalytic subunit